MSIELNQMATKADLEAKIAELAATVDSGFTTLGDTLTTEIQQIRDAIAAGGDVSSSIALLDNLKTSLADKVAALQTTITDIVTPEAPPGT